MQPTATTRPPARRSPGVTIQDLWYSQKNGKADLTQPTARKGRGKRYRVTVVDPQGKVSTEAYKHKRDAEDRQKELSAKMVTGAYASPQAGKALFSDVAEDWYSTKGIRIKPSTLQGYRSLLDTHVLPKWGSAEVGNITWTAAQKWIAELKATDAANRKGKLSPSVIGNAHNGAMIRTCG